MACHLLGTLKGRGGVRVLINSPYLLEYGHVYGNWWLALVVIVGWSLDVKHVYLLIDVLFTILWNTFSAWTYFIWVQKLQSSFGEESLEAFGLLRSSRAIRAAGGLLGWALYAACSHPVYIVLHALVLSISFVPQYWFQCESEPFIQISFMKNLTGWLGCQQNKLSGSPMIHPFLSSHVMHMWISSSLLIPDVSSATLLFTLSPHSGLFYLFTQCLLVVWAWELVCKNMMSLNILNECMEFVSFSLLDHWSYCAFQHVCVRYVQETQKLVNEEIPLQKPSYYSVMDTMHMDDTVRSHLEVTPRSIFKQQF